MQVIKEGIIPLMRRNNPFFNKFFNSILHGGSYYKGTKVGKPNEYDLNMIILLPWRQDTLNVIYIMFYFKSNYLFILNKANFFY